jgi:hypothetical protein
MMFAIVSFAQSKDGQHYLLTEILNENVKDGLVNYADLGN